MPKVKKKRIAINVDMTPMVDITFLLLTFFMFTAKFKSEAESEQKFIIHRPESSADTSKVPTKDLATIKIAIDSTTKDTIYYYEMVNENDRAKVWSACTMLTDDQRSKAQVAVNTEVLYDLVKKTRLVRPETIFAIDADKKLRFKWVQDAMDILRKNLATKFNYVTDKRGGGL